MTPKINTRLQYVLLLSVAAACGGRAEEEATTTADVSTCPTQAAHVSLRWVTASTGRRQLELTTTGRNRTAQWSGLSTYAFAARDYEWINVHHDFTAIPPRSTRRHTVRLNGNEDYHFEALVWSYCSRTYTTFKVDFLRGGATMRCFANDRPTTCPAVSTRRR